MSDGTPAPKRAKLFRACDTCVSSKTRCDDLTPAGCILCRKKSRQCSLVEPTGDRVNLEEECREAKARLNVVEARAWDLELRLRQMEAGSTTTTLASEPVHISHPPPLPMPSAPAIDLEVLMDVGKTNLWPFDERIHSIITKRQFPDVIERGLVTREQVDMLFQLWKHRWSPALPLAPFLLTTTPSPSHPFVVAAILSHMASTNTPALHALINESVSQVMYGAISLDAMLALLILSLNPCSPSIPSATRLISLAYQMGLALNLEEEEEAGIEMGDELCQPWFREKLEQMLLWEAVKHQYNVITISTARTTTLASSFISHFPDYPADNIRQATRHLQHSVAMTDVFRDLIKAISKAEATALYTTPDFDGLAEVWERTHEQTEHFRGNEAQVGVGRTALFLEFTLSMRIVKFTQFSPSPINSDLKENAKNTVGRDLVRISQTVVEVWNEMETDENHPLTAHTMQMVVGAIAVIMVVWALVHVQYPLFLGMEIEKAYAAERKVHETDKYSSEILTRHRQVHAPDLDRVETETPSAGLSGLNGSDQLSILDLDLSAWSWLFQGGQA